MRDADARYILPGIWSIRRELSYLPRVRYGLANGRNLAGNRSGSNVDSNESNDRPREHKDKGVSTVLFSGLY